MLALLLTLAQLADGQVIETQHPPDAVIQRVETWAALNFDSAQDAVQKTGETFVAKGYIDWPCKGFSCMVKSDWRLHFTLRVDTKDGRFRVQILDPEVAWPPSPTGPAHQGPIRQKGDQKAAGEALTALTEGLIATVQDSADDDW